MTVSERPNDVRKSLPLSHRDIDDVRRLRLEARRRDALSAVSGLTVPESASEAFVLRALVEAGLAAVRSRLEEESYRSEAVDRLSGDPEHRSMARRRRPAWAGEA